MLSLKRSLAFWISFSLLFCGQSVAQIADPCLQSVTPLGFFNNSTDVVNLCGGCPDNHKGADLIEWDGSKWNGQLSSLHRRPPSSCNQRGFWLGYDTWTEGGEGVGLRLSKPLETGKIYSITITYAKDGTNTVGSGGFSPIIYATASKPIYIKRNEMLGRFPVTDDWVTNTFTFIATSAQNGYEWIILHAFEVSGTILSMCISQHPIVDFYAVTDTTICSRESLILKAVGPDKYDYSWNTGEHGNQIIVTSPGTYAVVVSSGQCRVSDSIRVDHRDCDPRLVMPNVFTPNDDGLNEVFIPIEYNYIDSGVLKIFDRWGLELYKGDVFRGWDGKEASAGIYYYIVLYNDEERRKYEQKGWILLRR